MKKTLHTLASATLIIAALGLSACSPVAPNIPDPYLTTQAVRAEAPPASTDVSADFAAAYLPTLAGGVQSVRQTVSTNSLVQEIVYSNRTALAGENIVSIKVAPPESSRMINPPSKAQILREMRSALPGLSASLSPVIGENAYGTYGFATASFGSGGSCIYAWQRIRSVNPSDADGGSALTRKNLSASVRVRYCHPAIAADRIHVLMDGLQVKPMTSDTIDMLRFAAGSARVASPDAVYQKPEIRRTVVTRPRTPRSDEVSDDDWRKAAAPKTAAVTPSAGIDIPMPGGASAEAVTVPVDGDKTASTTPVAASVDVPLPE